MKMSLTMTAMAISLAATGAVFGPAMAQTGAQTETLTTKSEDWNAFSRGTKAYLTDVNDFVTTGDVVSAKVAKVPLQGAAGDYSYGLDQIELRCASKQSRLVFSVEYGPDGVQTDRFDDAEAWAPFAPNTRDAFLAQMVCDGDRASPPTWTSIKAYIDGGRP